MFHDLVAKRLGGTTLREAVNYLLHGMCHTRPKLTNPPGTNVGQRFQRLGNKKQQLAPVG
jgi:hypothetical protein